MDFNQILTVTHSGLCVSDIDVSEKSRHSSTSDDHKLSSQKCDAFFPLQKASKLRFVSAVEFRYSSGNLYPFVLVTSNA